MRPAVWIALCLVMAFQVPPSTSFASPNHEQVAPTPSPSAGKGDDDAPDKTHRFVLPSNGPLQAEARGQVEHREPWLSRIVFRVHAFWIEKLRTVLRTP